MGESNGTNGHTNGDTNGHTNGHTNGQHDEIPLPSAKPYEVATGISIHPPLTRQGHGPALILLMPEGLDLKGSDKTLDPPPLQKWAEEGWAVAQIIIGDDDSNFQDRLKRSLSALEKLNECDSTEKTGLIAINVKDSEHIWKAVDATDEIVAVITYGSSISQTTKPQLNHLSADAASTKPPKGNKKNKSFTYDSTNPHFVVASHEDYSSGPAGVSHTRSLGFLKPYTNGPYFDLEAIWDEHCLYEFGERAVEKTMATMVQEPYVNHIPVITGGIGRAKLTDFYRHHFVFQNPDDTKLDLVSRTVGVDRVIDEFVFSFTHDRMIDWLAPGVPPTGKKCELPFIGIINIRGDRLYHEHIAWDQATALRQMGLLPEYLPFPYAIDGKNPSSGKSFEYRVPAAGVETSRKLVDERSVPSNELISGQYEVREV